ncbi:hypothetical protein HW560_22265 [Paenibacillus sp. E222]|uniref:hypothetical protein n=1 Tax=Paenibacillus sp. E222 TaxID=2748863 RepID=UPI0015C65451|nr:hypothetical protein [Paenibacillus sp. E222]QLG40554.1 hypothetical protein HW560_22265 [Paenibacillus sp. E222]
MARSTIMLAVAGSGKTYYIANELDPTLNNLVITYTKQNVENLKRELILKYGSIPSKTQVLTFSSFVYRWLLKPFEPVLEIGDKVGLISEGVEIFQEPEPLRKLGSYNPKYVRQNNHKHYILKKKYYSSRMSSLFLSQSPLVLKMILQRLQFFCNHIYFDELQDFMGDDFKLLVKLIKTPNLQLFAVGDFNQHSVSKSDFTATKPFQKTNKRYLFIEEYKQLFGKKVFIDEFSLINSRRVPKEICSVIKKKLGIRIESISEVSGFFKLLLEHSEIVGVLNDPTVVKLFYNNSQIYNISPAINWSYSKGDTYEKCCIILTKTFDDLFDEHFSYNNLSPMQVNTLYVAMTRSTHELYFIREKDFKKIKSNFLIANT